MDNKNKLIIGGSIAALVIYIGIGGLVAWISDHQENKYANYKTQRKAEANTGGKKYTRRSK
jgi:hypothetical protein